MRVLIADTDTAFSTAARVALRSDALVIELAASVAEVLDRTSASPYAALVIALDLDGGRGIELLIRLRGDGVAAPILALTADAAPPVRVEAIRQGADDCLVKPVLMAELVARVHALARRAGRRTGDCLEVEDLVLHRAKRCAFRAGDALPLTDREFSALEFLVRAYGRPVSASELLAALWDGKAAPKDNFIAVLMMRVRRKVDDGYATKLIHTVRGSGYAVRVANVDETAK